MLACSESALEMKYAERRARIIPETLLDVQNTAASTTGRRPIMPVSMQK
jgi:hypothetical protein